MTIIFHPRYIDHLQNFGHPESPQRLIDTVQKLKDENLFNNIISHEIGKIENLEKIHTKEHLNGIKNFGEGYYDMDTFVRKETFEIASLAASGTILAGKLAYEKKIPTFAITRPPGHHAGSDYAGGFCYFNNIAVAAKNMDCKTAIIDIDVHHGNGTSDIFYDDKNILYISTHQSGIFPGTGALRDNGKGDGEGFNVNIPFCHGCGDSSYDVAFNEIIEPITSQFEPEIILVSIGTDAHYSDPLASLTLSTPGYLNLNNNLIELSKKICGGKISFTLEGGYNTKALAEVIAGTIGNLQNKKFKYVYNDVKDKNIVGKEIIEKVKNIQSSYWKL